MFDHRLRLRASYSRPTRCQPRICPNSICQKYLRLQAASHKVKKYYEYKPATIIRKLGMVRAEFVFKFASNNILVYAIERLAAYCSLRRISL